VRGDGCCPRPSLDRRSLDEFDVFLVENAKDLVCDVVVPPLHDDVAVVRRGLEDQFCTNAGFTMAWVYSLLSRGRPTLAMPK
jgi:hypothetical protein